MFTDLVTEVEHLSGLASDFLAVSGGRGATDVHGGDELRGAPSQQRPPTPREKLDEGSGTQDIVRVPEHPVKRQTTDEMFSFVLAIVSTPVSQDW